MASVLLATAPPCALGEGRFEWDAVLEVSSLDSESKPAFVDVAGVVGVTGGVSVGVTLRGPLKLVVSGGGSKTVVVGVDGGNGAVLQVADSKAGDVTGFTSAELVNAGGPLTLLGACSVKGDAVLTGRGLRGTAESILVLRISTASKKAMWTTSIPVLNKDMLLAWPSILPINVACSADPQGKIVVVFNAVGDFSLPDAKPNALLYKRYSCPSPVANPF